MTGQDRHSDGVSVSKRDGKKEAMQIWRRDPKRAKREGRDNLGPLVYQGEHTLVDKPPIVPY